MSKREKVIDCSLCSRRFYNRAGLSGHLQFFHKQKGPVLMTSTGSVEPSHPPPLKTALPKVTLPGPAAASDFPTILELETECRRLELSDKLARLRATQASPSQSDITSEAGLGSLAPSVKEQVQARALGLGVDPASSDPLSQLTRNLESLKVLKEVLGGDRGGVGDLLALLQALPKLNELYGKQATIATTPIGFRLGAGDDSIELSGVPLTAETLALIVGYRNSEEDRKQRAAKDEMLGSGLQSLVKILTSTEGGGVSILEKITDRSGGGSSYPGIGQRPVSPLPTSVQAPPPPQSIECPQCSQQISTLGLSPGSKIVCPICDEELMFQRPDEVLPPAPVPKPEEEGDAKPKTY